MLKLVVKNFGVLKDVEIQLNKTNLFIGDNSSGKSVLAKLITIITNFTFDEKEILDKFKEYNIDFLTEDSFIELKNDKEIFVSIKLNNIDIHEEIKKSREIYSLLKELSEVSKISKLIDDINSKNEDNLILKKHVQEDIENFKKLNLIEKDIDEKIYEFKILESKYIPAERNLISLFNQSLSNLITSNIPLPKTLLEFSSEYNSARNEISELSLLNLSYKSESGQDRVYYKKDSFLPLENSSSGIQSALPLYITLKYFNKKHKNIIIEEPEQNLYPKSQVDTIKYIVENSFENLYLMTHSPYILSTLNILLFAYKAANTNDILKEKISQVIPESQQINPDKFSAYFIEDGKAIDIKSKRGLISENAIDDSSDFIDDEFDKLMDIYREYKDV